MPWLPKKSRKSGKVYYFNTDTKETTWEKPTELVEVLKKLPQLDRKVSSKGVSSKGVSSKGVSSKGVSSKGVSSAYSGIATHAGKTARVVTKKIRSWNNLIKRHLIHKYLCGYMDLKVLDICCGRGGDMGKILQYTCVKRYRGIDISDGAIHEAINRSVVHNKHGTWMDFFVMDVSSGNDWTGYSALEKGWNPGEKQYNTLFINENYNATRHHFSFINMQYALHYMCKTKKALREFLKRLYHALDPGPFGVWVGTVPSAERIQQAIQGTYKLPSYCTVSPSGKWKGNGRLGDPYTFFLQDCVPHVEEYLLPKEEFIALAKQCGLKNVLYMNAGEYLERETARRIDGYYQFNTGMECTTSDCHRINVDEELNWQVTSLYDVFAFVRVVETTSNKKK